MRTFVEQVRLWLLPLAGLVLSAQLGAAPAPPSWADTSMVSDTAQPLLPSDALSRMTAFLTRFNQESAVVRAASIATQEEIHFHLSVQFDTPPFSDLCESPRGVNMIALVADYPAVAADLREASLTPQQWEEFRRSLYAASVMDRMMQMGLPAFGDVTLWRNVRFLRNHAQDVKALVAIGLPLPRVANLDVNTGGQNTQAVPALPPLPAPRTLSLPNLSANSDQVTVVPFQVSTDRVSKDGHIFVSAEVDGHRGTFLLDTGSPLIFLNPDYLRPNPAGGLDTVTTRPHPPLDSAPFVTVHTLRLGSIQYQFAAGPVEIAGEHFRTNAYVLDDQTVRRVVQPDGYPVLGFIGLAALSPFETIIDYTHQRLILIRLDAGGHRLVSVPAYQPAAGMPLVPTSDSQHYGVSVVAGGMHGVYMLDTGNPVNEVRDVTLQRLGAHLVAKQTWGDWTLDTLYVGSHQYENVPISSSALSGLPDNDILGYPFLRSFGTVGFNFRTRQFLLYH